MIKVLTSITVFFYFVVSCGVVVNLHYCMGDLESFELYSAKMENCGSCDKCGMELAGNDGCCKDEVKVIKLQVDQNTAHASYGIQGLDASSFSPSAFITAPEFNVEKSPHYKNHSPPLLTGQDTYLLNCVFRI